MEEKTLVILHGEIKTPPMSKDARRETGFFLWQIQRGFMLSMPHSRPMPSIGAGCHELRIVDKSASWRIVYCVAEREILILEVFAKTTQQTPQTVIDACKARLREYLKP